jgi:S-methylmethionine-dependent homocysteine/selenocysteine methylase
MTLSRTLLLSTTLTLLTFGIALAQDANIEASTDASVQTQTSQPIKPLDALRRAKEMQQGINTDAREARQDWRAETRAEMQDAEPGARSGVMREAMPERMQIAKDRMASTTTLRMKMKALVQRHGGLIRERFTNAITHLEKFMARIDSRVHKLSDEGVDVGAVVTLQTDAEAAITEAKTDIEAVRTYMSSVTDESNRETVKAEIEPLIETAQDSIREAHAAVRAVIKALVELAKTNKEVSAEVEVEANASTSVESQ